MVNSGLIGSSKKFQAVLDDVQVVAQRNALFWFKEKPARVKK